MARHLVERELGDLLDAHIDDERLTSEAARTRGRRALANYGAGALLFPYHRFLEAAEDQRYDIERLGRQFDGSVEQIAHRLVTLRRPGAEGVPFAFLRADPAGNISKPFSIPGLRMPRFGGACPLWIIYNAFATPNRTVAQLATMPQGERYLFVAHCMQKQAAAFGSQATTYSIMLGCDASYGDRMVYGDGFVSGRDSLATPVGTNCRSCGRQNCRQRAHPSIIAPSDGGARVSASNME
jgi:predicted transcriptional regulator